MASQPAAAQQSPADKADEDRTQTIVISAHKRLEKQREVAGTVSVLGFDPEHGGRRLRWFNRSMAAVLVLTAAWMTQF